MKVVNSPDFPFPFWAFCGPNSLFSGQVYFVITIKTVFILFLLRYN